MTRKPSPAALREAIAIRNVRIAKGWTQTELAERANVPHGQRGVSDIEYGAHAESYLLYRRIRKALGLLIETHPK